MIEALCIALSFLISLGIIPVVIVFCKKYSLYDPVNARKIHSGSIPRLGGIGIVLGFALSLVTYRLITGNKDVPWLLVGAGTLLFVYCILDDLLNLPAVLKLIIQIMVSMMALISGCRISGLFEFHIPELLNYILTIAWILGITNSYNLIDGLDGLCGGLSSLVLLTLGIMFMQIGINIGFTALLLTASTIGFLAYNWPDARIFMGDCGSQFLGFMIAALPFTLQVTPELDDDFIMIHNLFFVMILLVSIPMTDTFAAILRRLRDHRSVISPDRMHLHHKLLNLGLSKISSLHILLFVQMLICGCAFGAVHMGPRSSCILLCSAYVFVVFLFVIIHYIHRAVLKKIGQYGEPITEFPTKE